MLQRVLLLAAALVLTACASGPEPPQTDPPHGQGCKSVGQKTHGGSGDVHDGADGEQPFFAQTVTEPPVQRHEQNERDRIGDGQPGRGIGGEAELGAYVRRRHVEHREVEYGRKKDEHQAHNHADFGPAV